MTDTGVEAGGDIRAVVEAGAMVVGVMILTRGEDPLIFGVW